MPEAVIKRRFLEGSYSYADAVEYLRLVLGYPWFAANYAVDAWRL